MIGGRVIGGMKLGFSATPQVSGRAQDEPRECGLCRWISHGCAGNERWIEV